MERGTHPLILGRSDVELTSLACDMRHKQFVEIRILLGESGNAAKSAEFARLASRAARLGWSGAMPEVIDFGEDGGSLFYVFPFRDGEPLDSYLSHVLSLGTVTALSWASGLAQAISSLGATPSLQARCGQTDHKVVLDGDHGATLQLADLGLGRALAGEGVRPEQGLENAFRVVGSFLQRIYAARTVAGRPVVLPIQESGLPEAMVASVEQLIGISEPSAEIPSLAALRQVLMEAEVAAGDLNENASIPPPHLVLDRFVEGSEEFSRRAGRVGIDVGSIKKASNRYACEFVDPENGERRVRQPLPPRAFLGGLDLDNAGQKLSSLDPADVPNLMRVYELADANAPVQGYIEEAVGGATLSSVLDAAGGRVSAWELSPLLEQLHEALLQAEANSLLPARITLDDIFWEPRERRLKLRVLPTTASLAGHRWRQGERFETGGEGGGTEAFVKLALGLLGGRMMNGGVVLPESAPAGLAARFAEFLVPGGGGQGRLTRQRFLSSWSEIVGKLNAPSSASIPAMLSPHQKNPAAPAESRSTGKPISTASLAANHEGRQISAEEKSPPPVTAIGVPAESETKFAPAQQPAASALSSELQAPVQRSPRLAPPKSPQSVDPFSKVAAPPAATVVSSPTAGKAVASPVFPQTPATGDLAATAPAEESPPAIAPIARQDIADPILPPRRTGRNWGGLVWFLLLPLLLIALAGWAYFSYGDKLLQSSGNSSTTATGQPSEVMAPPPNANGESTPPLNPSIADSPSVDAPPAAQDLAVSGESGEIAQNDLETEANPISPASFPEPKEDVPTENLPDLELAQGVLDQGTPPAPDSLPEDLPQPPAPDVETERVPVTPGATADHLMAAPGNVDPTAGASETPVVADGPGFIDAEADSPAGNHIAAAQKFSTEGNSSSALQHYLDALELEGDNVAAKSGLLNEIAMLAESETALADLPITQLERASSADIAEAKALLEETKKPEPEPDDLISRAENGDVAAMLELGDLAASAQSGENLEEAAMWFDRAADAGDENGLYLSGECHLLGKGVPENVDKAIVLLEKAAAMDEPRALDLLGVCLVRGMGVKKNLKRARELFQRSIDEGNLSACANLGALWINGEGGEKDATKAAELFEKGASAGNQNSMFYLAQCYELGLGIEADPAKALRWYRIAAGDGHMAAISWCEENGVRWKK